MLWGVFSVCLLPSSCRLSHQRLQLLLHQMHDGGNLRRLVRVSFIIYPAWVSHIICHEASHFEPTAFLT